MMVACAGHTHSANARLIYPTEKLTIYVICIILLSAGI